MANLRPVTVQTTKSLVAGMLYFRTRRHVVLLNNKVVGMGLGPVRSLVKNHYSHEADIVVIPTSDVVRVTFMDAKM